MMGRIFWRTMDRLIRLTVNLVLLAAMLFGGFSLWDTSQILGAADTGRVRQLRPVSSPEQENGQSFEELLQINPDVRGWITAEGTGIDYPVVQGPDNQTYVNQNVFGEYAISGSIFLDCRNAGDFSDPYSLIYGHHMEGNRMFGALDQYRDPRFFETHAEGKLILPGGSLNIRWFCLVSADAWDDRIFNPEKTGTEQIADFAGYLHTLSIYESAYERKKNTKGRLIALSTCQEAGSTKRLVLVGYLEKPVFVPGRASDGQMERHASGRRGDVERKN